MTVEQLVAFVGLSGFLVMALGYALFVWGFVTLGLLVFDEVVRRVPRARGPLAVLLAGVFVSLLGRGLWQLAVWLE